MKATTEQLNERQRDILSALVRQHLRSAEAVGSAELKEHEHFELSAATLRSEMKRLEDLGLLAQPHTSAGRVPTALGYRAYVDQCIETTGLEPTMRDHLDAALLGASLEPSGYVRAVSATLSRFGQLPSCALPPRAMGAQLDHMELAPLSSRRFVALMITSTGEVLHRVVETSRAAGVAEVERITLALNRRLQGKTLAELGRLTSAELLLGTGLASAAALELASALLEAAREASSGPETVIVEGTLQILGQPEFRDMALTRGVLSVLEDRQRLAGLLNRMVDPEADVQVAIGEELGLEEMRCCSLVSAVYHAQGAPVGIISLIGPMRMPYSFVMQLASFMAARLSSRLDQQPA